MMYEQYFVWERCLRNGCQYRVKICYLKFLGLDLFQNLEFLIDKIKYKLYICVQLGMGSILGLNTFMFLQENMFIVYGINNIFYYQCRLYFVINELEKCLIFGDLGVLELQIRDCLNFLFIYYFGMILYEFRVQQYIGFE